MIKCFYAVTKTSTILRGALKLLKVSLLTATVECKNWRNIVKGEREGEKIRRRRECFAAISREFRFIGITRMSIDSATPESRK